MNLEQIKLKPLHEPKDIGDEWRTPRALALGIEAECGPFSYDLFTDGKINTHFPRFVTNGQNSLVVNWAEMAADDAAMPTGFANPPYSRADKTDTGEWHKGLKACMDKAHAEMLAGFKSVWLVPSATGAGWFPRHTASEIWYLEGRVTFEVPEWYRQDPDAPYPSSARGDSVIVIFDPHHVGKQITRYPKTRDLIKRGEAVIEARDYNAVHLWLTYGVTEDVAVLESRADHMIEFIKEHAIKCSLTVNPKQLLAQVINDQYQKRELTDLARSRTLERRVRNAMYDMNEKKVSA